MRWGSWKKWSERSSGEKARRVALWTVFCLVGVLLLENIVLNVTATASFLARSFDKDEEGLAVKCRFAWALWPSVVHVQKLEVRGSDHNVQWWVELDRARVTVSLGDLVHRELHATKVRGEGAHFRLRQRLSPMNVTPGQAEGLPPIDGFDDPPLVPAWVKEPDVADADYDLWSLRVEDVDVGLSEAWVDDYRYEGEARATGHFFLKPKRWLYVGPAAALFSSGTVSIASVPVLTDVQGRVDCTIDSFDPRIPEGSAVLHSVSGGVVMDAKVQGVEALEHHFRAEGTPVQFSGGAGTYHIDGRVEHGVVRPLHLSATLKGAHAAVHAWDASASLQVDANVDAVGHLEASLQATGLELRNTKVPRASLRADAVHAGVAADKLDLTEPMPPPAFRVELPAATADDIRLAQPLLGEEKSVRLQRGALTLSASFDCAEGSERGEGKFALASDDLAVLAGEKGFAGRLRASAHLQSDRKASDVQLQTGVVDVRELRSSHTTPTLEHYWAHVDLAHGRWLEGKRFPWTVSAAARLASAAPFLMFVGDSSPLPGWATNLLVSGEVTASARVAMGPSRYELTEAHASMGILRVEGAIRKEGENRSGAFGLRAGPLSVGLEIRNDSTHVVLGGTPEQGRPSAAP